MNAQFQLGFELTNILNPANQAVSAISSIAIVDAVRKAGSDGLTELKLASFLGKNRIVSILEAHFRQAVAKSERNLVSRYIEIVLESGAGPTVQNALKDTALFSMIVQMSLLCSVHEHQPFANAMVEAIERIVRDFKGNPQAIPDYPSLLGTMRVIQRETVAFQWSALFDSVERTIRDRLTRANSHRKPPAKKRKPNKPSLLNLERESIKDRGLSFPILQALLLALDSLQHFPQERQIFIECGTGISTLVVWCFHVLGLSVKVCIEDREVTFGDGPFNVLIKDIFKLRSSVSLIIPLSQDEPLFTLSSSERDPKFGPELRAKILGFGQAALKEVDVQPRDIIPTCYSVIAGALAILNRGCSCKTSSWLEINLPEIHEAHCNRTPRRFPGRSRILEAARMLFGLLEVDETILKVDCTQTKSKGQKARAQLVPLLLSLSRVQHQDLEQCADVPLSIKVFKTRLNSGTSNPGLLDMEFPNITESFEILAHYLLGQRYSACFIEQAVLVSECAWSIFFDAIDATDPSDVSICNLRMAAGVPSVEDTSKNRVVKDRVLDDPTELSFSHSDSTILRADWSSKSSSVNFFPGVSTAKRGNPLIGFRDNDAFLATQSFTWNFKGTEAKTHILGFREMLELCKDSIWLSPCACDDKTTELVSLKSGQHFTIEGSIVYKRPPKGAEDLEFLNSESAVCFFPDAGECTKGNDATWIFYVTKNPAARWLQMDDMARNTEFWEKTDPQLFIRDNETCMLCASKVFSESSNQHANSLVLL